MIKWRKSSHSGGQGGIDCVEVAAVARTAMIRDSKDPAGPHLTIPRTDLCALITAIKSDRYA
jgi:hypothetical protein